MAFEFIKEFPNNYVQDVERGIILKKNGGGAGFKSFKFIIDKNVYDVVAETISLGGVDELWTIKGIRNDDLKDKRSPVELYDTILESLIAYKTFAYKRMHDTIIINLDDRLVKLKERVLS